MIEELTPQVLMASMALIILTAPVVTLVISLVLISRYRRAVAREMAATVGFRSGAPSVPAEPVPRPRGDAALYRRMLRGARMNAMRYALAGGVFALVFAVAAHFVYPSGLGVPGFLVAVWIYFWPVLVALPLIVPAMGRAWFAWVFGYFAVLALLGVWASTVMNLPAFTFGAISLPERSTMTPAGMIRLWLTVNAGPTLLAWLCLRRRVRAVAPLVLAIVTVALVGTLTAALALFSPRGVDAAVAFSVATGVHVGWLVAATYAGALAGFGVLGWLFARAIAHAYRQRRASDQSLMVDSLFAVFAATYGMWLVLGGVAWIATAALALAAYGLTWAAMASIFAARSGIAPGLAFLRVFSLGRRSESLLDAVAGYWRIVGTVQMITGPDVAHATVQPHQFLDFLSGTLGRHFVRDDASLERSLAQAERTPDPDGRFRINSFFCHADSWQAVLPRLVRAGDIVLMDLRNFSAANAGCLHELRYLAREVPVDRCVLIVDHTTDEAFLELALQQAREQLPLESPDRQRDFGADAMYRFRSGGGGVRDLLRRLCAAAGD